MAAPRQFGTAKDPVNLLGFVGSNILEGLCPLADWDAVFGGADGAGVVLDVRNPGEPQEDGELAVRTNLPFFCVEGSVFEVIALRSAAAPAEPQPQPQEPNIHIPLPHLRARFEELPRDTPINVLCR